MDRVVFWLSVFGIIVMGMLTFYVVCIPSDVYDYWAKVAIHVSLLERVLTLIIGHGTIYALLILCLVGSLKKQNGRKNGK